MRYRHDLRAVGRLRDEASKGWQQVRVQARLGLVQDEEAWRARRQERRDPEQVPQRAVRQFGGLQRTKQPVLLHLDLEPSTSGRHRHTTAGKRVVDRLVHRRTVADLANGLERRRQVAAVIAEDRRVRADLRQPRRSGRVGPEVIVEPPGAHLLAHGEHLGRVPWIGALRHHAVEAGQVLRDDRPLAIRLARLDQRPAAIHEHR